MLMRVATVTDTEDYRVKVRHASFHHLCDVIERKVMIGCGSADPLRRLVHAVRRLAGQRPRRPAPGGVVPTHGSPAGTAPRSDGPPRDGRLSVRPAVRDLKPVCCRWTGSTPLPSPSQGVCPTAGCRGVGHIKGAKYTGHHRYRPPHLVIVLPSDGFDPPVSVCLCSVPSDVRILTST